MPSSKAYSMHTMLPQPCCSLPLTGKCQRMCQPPQQYARNNMLGIFQQAITHKPFVTIPSLQPFLERYSKAHAITEVPLGPPYLEGGAHEAVLILHHGAPQEPQRHAVTHHTRAALLKHPAAPTTHHTHPHTLLLGDQCACGSNNAYRGGGHCTCKVERRHRCCLVAGLRCSLCWACTHA